MRADEIRVKLAKYYHKESDSIILEALQGKPRSTEGGIWIEAKVSDIEAITESPDFNPETTGYKKYLEKWHNEGLITRKEMMTGKS
jgi:hypothetical protein